MRVGREEIEIKETKRDNKEQKKEKKKGRKGEQRRNNQAGKTVTLLEYYILVCMYVY